MGERQHFTEKPGEVTRGTVLDSEKKWFWQTCPHSPASALPYIAIAKLSTETVGIGVPVSAKVPLLTDGEDTSEPLD
jgi:hypothetical protein